MQASVLRALSAAYLEASNTETVSRGTERQAGVFSRLLGAWTKHVRLLMYRLLYIHSVLDVKRASHSALNALNRRRLTPPPCSPQTTRPSLPAFGLNRSVSGQRAHVFVPPFSEHELVVKLSALSVHISFIAASLCAPFAPAKKAPRLRMCICTPLVVR